MIPTLNHSSKIELTITSITIRKRDSYRLQSTIKIKSGKGLIKRPLLDDIHQILL